MRKDVNMKLSKKIKLGAAASVVALALAGCGSPKDDLTDAYKELAEAKTYELKTELALSVVGDTVADPSMKEALSLLDSLKVTSHAKVDNEKQQINVFTINNKQSVT